MDKIENNALGAVGEHQVLSRLLLLGYDAAITNLSVNNMKGTDILCRDQKGRFKAIQIKTTTGESFYTGFSHNIFYNTNGQIDLNLGREYLEKNIVGPWVFVKVGGSSVFPTFEFFVFSRKQIIELIYSSEEWYLTGFNRTKPLKSSGSINVSVAWMQGLGIPAKGKHIAWVNPFAAIGLKFEDAWHNLWID